MDTLIQEHDRMAAVMFARRPADCTCHGWHTDAVEASIPDTSIAALIAMEPCPAERRALVRILHSR